MKNFNQPKPLFAAHGSRAVLLLHAYSGSSNDVRMLARYLEKLEYTIYTPMFSGHGTANPQDILNQKTATWEDEVTTAIAFLQKKGYKEIAILGLSMGGIFAMKALTSKDPVLLGGGAFCSPLFPAKTQVPENFLKYAKLVLPYSSFSEAKQKAILAEVPMLVKRQLKAIQEVGNQAAQQLNKINVPIFLAQAGQDEMIDPKTVFDTVQGLSQTKYTVQWYPKSGHVVTVGPERKQFEQDVAAFLDSLPWKG